jgi:hypothetical protein
MTTFNWLLAAVLALPTSRYDRDPSVAEAKAAQRREIASAVADAAAAQRWPGPKYELAALLLAVGQRESGFALHVGRGELRRWEGDPDKDGNPRSVSFWQIQRKAASSPEAWAAARSDIRVAAREAARVLARSRYQCRTLERAAGDWLRLTLTAYGTGSCRGYLKDLDLRVATYSRILGRVGT